MVISKIFSHIPVELLGVTPESWGQLKGILALGAGSISSSIITALARAQVQSERNITPPLRIKLTVVDPDRVKQHNLNKSQYTKVDIGLPKVQALKKHVARIEPAIDYTGLTCKFQDLEEEDVFALFDDHNMVLNLADCRDCIKRVMELAWLYKAKAGKDIIIITIQNFDNLAASFIGIDSTGWDKMPASQLFGKHLSYLLMADSNAKLRDPSTYSPNNVINETLAPGIIEHGLYSDLQSTIALGTSLILSLVYPGRENLLRKFATEHHFQILSSWRNPYLVWQKANPNWMGTLQPLVISPETEEHENEEYISESVPDINADDLKALRATVQSLEGTNGGNSNGL